MDVETSSDTENWPVETEESYNPAYYRDVAQCFVTSCLKHRRDYPHLSFLTVPKCLKETWCQALARNCPKRTLYVCEEHINVPEDCIKNKAGKWRLKKTANLILTKTYTEVPSHSDVDVMHTATEPVTTSSKDSSSKNESNFSSQTESVSSNKAVLAKPSTRSVSCSVNINIKATYISEKIIPTRTSNFQLEAPSGSSTPTLYEPSSPSTSSTREFVVSENLSGRHHILSLIKENPTMYIGVPKHYYWLIDYISRKYSLRSLHVIVALFKIRLNDSIKRICDHFCLSHVTVQEIFNVCIPRLATYLQDFLYLPEANPIKRTLPPAFKPRYANVKCIIDCFEIEIEKPSNPMLQSRSWSQYKSCNTVKYLIACWPNGFICFVSRGYGGRISDKTITELSDFADILPPGAVILADRGFKAIEELLKEKQLRLLRPPSVSANKTPTKAEVIKGKVLASLRIHVERVIRRVREFRLLKPHSVINHNHVRYLDECVIIACALSNLQGNIIKTQ